jgi:RHS repeat-associated protein
MTHTLLRAGALSCALLASTCLTAPAAAQSAPAFTEYRSVDGNGVDLVNGGHLFSFEEGSIGSGPGKLSLVRRNAQYGGSQWDGVRLVRTSNGTNAPVEIRLPGGVSETFAFGTNSPNGTTIVRANGSRLTKNQRHSYTYVSAGGTAVTFGDPTQSYDSEMPPTTFCTVNSQDWCELLPETMAAPGGESLTFWHDIYAMPDGSGGTSYETRLAKVANSFGYSITFVYQDDSQSWGTPPSAAWRTRSGAQFRNETLSASVQSSVSYAYPSAGVTEITDMAGQVWRIAATATSTAVRRPGALSDTFSASSSGNVLTVVNEGVTTTYTRTVSGSTATMTVTDALNRQTVIESDLTKGRPTKVTQVGDPQTPNSRVTQYGYDASNRLTRITAPEGNYVEYTLDARGNATTTSIVAKPGSGAATITTSASFAASCTATTLAVCNQPTSVTDARGNVTDFTYDAATGHVLSVTSPAATTGADRAQTRYSYTLTNGEYLLTAVSACASGTAPSCVGTANESRQVAAYDSNGNVTSVTARDGTGDLSAVQAMTYDPRGNLLTVDGPLAGAADTTRMRYDAGNRLVGTVSADPDGSGALLHRATRVTYTNALPTKQEVGTVASQSDADWANFVAAQEVQTTYDAHARPTVQRLVGYDRAVNPAQADTYSLTQTSYDALGRAECVAQRMNPAEFTSLPASACTLDTEGAFGPDRITKTIRDEMGQVSEVRTAVGTPLEAPEVRTTYRANGQAETLTDAAGNRTTYVYDGHDRLTRTYYPVTTVGAETSSTADYEEYGYDAAGNATALRNRENQTTLFTFDALNRRTNVNRPGSEEDIAYGYDLVGRTVSASQTGNSLGFTYDALGRQLTQTGAHGTIGSEYDLAGRRTKLTHPGGYFVNQDYLVTGEMSAIRENGATSGLGVIASFTYDNQGRRTKLTRGNGVVTNYAYDAASRLGTLGHDFANTTNDVTLGFGYNPASQIAAQTRSNDLFSFAHAAGTQSRSHDGLNRIASEPTQPVSYDDRGNLTAEGGRTFGYSSDNRLTAMTGGGRTYGFAYDPAGRLHEVTATGIASRSYAWDGNDAIVTWQGGNSLARTVYGPGENEPLYQLDNQGRRRWFAQDERGSTIAASDENGTAANPIAYDEYGNTATGTVAYQHGYTGALHLRTTGLYYMRARIYDPKLGRFLQPDPIGYGDGMNMYVYVGGDPVNRSDPSGAWRLPETICRDGNSCQVNGYDYDLLQMAVRDYVYDQIQAGKKCDANPDCSLGSPASSDSRRDLYPLDSADQRLMTYMLRDPVFVNRMTDSWTRTIVSGTERAFFIWYMADRQRFMYGPIREGNRTGMGLNFHAEARQHYYYGDPFFATLHTHPPESHPTSSASIGDRNFLREFPSVMILRMEKGLIYGR